MGCDATFVIRLSCTLSSLSCTGVIWVSLLGCNQASHSQWSESQWTRQKCSAALCQYTPTPAICRRAFSPPAPAPLPPPRHPQPYFSAAVPVPVPSVNDAWNANVISETCYFDASLFPATCLENVCNGREVRECLAAKLKIPRRRKLMLGIKERCGDISLKQSLGWFISSFSTDPVFFCSVQLRLKTHLYKEVLLRISPPSRCLTAGQAAERMAEPHLQGHHLYPI